jgi:hypothetical protein
MKEIKGIQIKFNKGEETPPRRINSRGQIKIFFQKSFEPLENS